jgi:hypothetical protein
MADEETMQCERCFGEVHPDARACRHCGASFEDDGWFTPVQRAVLAWVATAAAAFTGGAMMVADEAANRGQGGEGGGGVLAGIVFLAAIPLAIVAIYYTIRAAARS